jgi:putative nucleotidyltransferase with HDIG domain
VPGTPTPGTRPATPAVRTRPISSAGTTLPDYAEGAPLAQTAGHLAQILLRGNDSRWRHTCAVAARAGEAAGTLPAERRALLLAAAWLHDIGYAQPVQAAGGLTGTLSFHPVSGARFLQAHHWPPDLVALVAHHSGAAEVGAVLGLRHLVDAHPLRSEVEPVADALTWADQTTGPAGQPWTLEHRLRDVLQRHGDASPNALAHAVRAPLLRSSVDRVEARRKALAGPDERAAPHGPR